MRAVQWPNRDGKQVWVVESHGQSMIGLVDDARMAGMSIASLMSAGDRIGCGVSGSVPSTGIAKSAL